MFLRVPEWAVLSWRSLVCDIVHVWLAELALCVGLVDRTCPDVWPRVALGPLVPLGPSGVAVLPPGPLASLCSACLAWPWIVPV